MRYRITKAKLFLTVGTCLHSILDYADRVKIKKVVWSIVENGGEDKKNQRNNYKKLLEGKEIIETCRNVIEILENYRL